ncbi:tyrosine/serine/threonine protein phosphatase [Dionaea muscipula]
MVAVLAVNPNFSTPFLGRELSSNKSKKEVSKRGLCCKQPKCALDAPYGGNNNISKFPRRNVWDPYKRLGISKYASEDEVWGSRNFLLQQYAGDERSAESIEAAFEKLLMKSFRARKATKINLKTRLKKKVEESPPWLQNFLKNLVELPPMVIILRRLFLFSFIAGWSIMNSAEGGPAFQVAIGLAACVFFLYDKTKSVGRGFTIGFGSLVTGWVCGSCLAPTIPTAILPSTWTLELIASMVVYVFLFLGCTFLK